MKNMAKLKRKTKSKKTAHNAEYLAHYKSEYAMLLNHYQSGLASRSAEVVYKNLSGMYITFRTMVHHFGPEVMERLSPGIGNWYLKATDELEKHRESVNMDSFLQRSVSGLSGLGSEPAEHVQRGYGALRWARDRIEDIEQGSCSVHSIGAAYRELGAAWAHGHAASPTVIKEAEYMADRLDQLLRYKCGLK